MLITPRRGGRAYNDRGAAREKSELTTIDKRKSGWISLDGKERSIVAQTAIRRDVDSSLGDRCILHRPTSDSTAVKARACAHDV